MLDSKTQKRLLDEFDRRRSTYEDFASELARLANSLIFNSDCVVHSVNSRCKSIESLSRKLALPGKAYAELGDVADLAGLRVTTYFAEDVDTVASIFEKEFSIDRRDSVDKRKSIDPDRFGYQSLHYVATLSDYRAALSENRRFKGIRFEVQIRSILQHAWAEIEHDLGYKSAAGVPREVRRRFARVAGLLELADAEFCGIRKQLQEYVATIDEQIKVSAADTELDLVSLRALYATSTRLQKLDEIVAERASSKLNAVELAIEDELAWLHRLGISTVADLERAIDREQPHFAHFVSYWLEDSKHLELDVGIGLFYLLYLLVRRVGTPEFVKEYCVASMFMNPDDVVEKLLAYVPAE